MIHVAMAIWLTTRWSLVQTTEKCANVTDVCVWGLYLSLKLEPMLDCSIVPIKHIFKATQKSRYGPTKDAALVPELL